MQKYQGRLSCFPVRKTNSHTSEMVTELLFGETFEIVETHGTWHKIKIDFDGYTGWIEDSEPQETNANTEKFVLTHSIIKNNLCLSAGSLIETQFEFKTKPLNEKWNNKKIAEQTKIFLNSPYRWGGKTMFGIDCSGFTQIIFRIGGYLIPRDSSDQFEQGQKVTFGQQQAGDLAFFSSPEKNNISHVGILLNENSIIHASEKVRIDAFTNDGIIRSTDHKLTHKLIGLKRIFD